jgi:hypothetical protein
VLEHEETVGDRFEGLEEDGAHREWFSMAAVVQADGIDGARSCQWLLVVRGHRGARHPGGGLGGGGKVGGGQ